MGVRIIKRLAAAMLCAALIISVPACAAGTEKDADIEKQLKLIADNAEEWWYVYGPDTEIGPMGFNCFAVTDLDHNGRLEIIGTWTNCVGTLNSVTSVYEVNEARDALIYCPEEIKNLAVSYSEPDLSHYVEVESITTYISDGVYSYIGYDTYREEADEHWDTVFAITLEGGVVYESGLSYRHDWTEGKSASGDIIFAGAYFDSNFQPLISDDPEAEFLDTDRHFPGAEKCETNVGWCKINGWEGLKIVFNTEEITETLRESYAVFGLVRENEN